MATLKALRRQKLEYDVAIRKERLALLSSERKLSEGALQAALASGAIPNPTSPKPGFEHLGAGTITTKKGK